jgi:tetratricopeptide (TPR) repeat protein
MPGRPVAAACAAALFAVHPLHTGTVSWIVARGDLMAALFGGLAVLAWGRRDGRDARSIALAGLAYFLALLSKEAAAPLPLALWLLDAGARREGLLGALRRRAWAYALLAIPLGAWWLLREKAVGGLGATSMHAALSGRGLLERLEVGAGAFVRTVARLFVPATPTGDGSADPLFAPGASISWAYGAAAFLVGVLALAALVAAWRGRVGALLGALGLGVALWLPTSQVVPIGAVFEDRFAYVPSVALLVVPGLAAEALARRLPRLVSAAGGVVVLAVAGAASWAVAADWHDDATFDRSLLRDEPDHVRALTRLGRTLLVDAKALRDRAASTPQGPAAEGLRLSLYAAASGKAQEAVRLLERGRALPRGHRDTSLLRTLGDAYLVVPSGAFEKAEATYAELLALKRVRRRGEWVPQARIRKDDVDLVPRADRKFVGETLSNRAQAATGMREMERAAMYASSAALWEPWSYERQLDAGVRWLSLDDPAKAIDFLEAAERLAPDAERAESAKRVREARTLSRTRSEQAYAKGVEVLDRMGPWNEALAAFEEAVRYRPNFARAWIELGWIVGKQKGNLRDGIAYLDRAKQLLDAEERETGKKDPETRARATERLDALRAEWGKDDEEEKDAKVGGR